MCTSKDTILSPATIKKLVGSKCDGVIGQLTEKWDADTFGALRSAGGTAYSNYAVGYDNVNVADATAAGVAVGNTPGARCRRRGAPSTSCAACRLRPCYDASRRCFRAQAC